MILFLSCVLSNSAASYPLEFSWPEYGTSARSNIGVKICIHRFREQFGTLQGYSESELITAVKNVVSIYNDYPQADFHMSYLGFTSVTDVGCDFSGLVADGNVYFSAAPICTNPSCRAHAFPNWSNDNLDLVLSGLVTIYKVEYPGLPARQLAFLYNGSSDSETLVHEMAHIMGYYTADEFGPPSSAANYGVEERFLWHEDFTQFKIAPPPLPSSCSECSPYTCSYEECPICFPVCGFEEYHQSLGYFIRHKVSRDGGISWISESDNLNERTNLPIGIDYGTTSSYYYPYVVAWVSSNGSNQIMTAIGNGVTWTNKVSTIFTSETGVGVAYGNGRWVLAWATPDYGTSTSRTIYWLSSTDGFSWTYLRSLQYRECQVCGPTGCSGCAYSSHGSLTGPGIEFDPVSGRFLIYFVNWDNESPLQGSLGKLRVCTISDPTVGVTNCSEMSSSFNLINLPSISCKPSDSCAITLAQAGGLQDNQLHFGCGSVDSNARFQFGPLTPMGATYSSRSELSTVYGPGDDNFVLAFRGQDGNTRGNSAIKVFFCDSWGGKSTWSQTFPYGPTTAYGERWNEFAIYYGGY